MAKRRDFQRHLGFSLVEMLVALVFTGLLMGGMAQVFKSSLSTFYTSGEKLSSARRNRMATDLLYDDLNVAGMYLADLSAPPSIISSGNPAFYIIPNAAIAGAGSDDPQTADQLFFYMDDPLPFEGSLYMPSGSVVTAPRTASELVLAQEAATTADSTYTIDCRENAYANMVKVGQSVIFKDFWETLYIQSVTPPSGTKVTITAGTLPTGQITGVGAGGVPSKAKHLDATGVVFIRPSQMVRYSVKMKALDPQKANGIPCLVRDQGTYAAGGFVPDPLQESIITENVSGFKAYISCDSGRNWAGMNNATGTPYTYSGFDDGWTGGIRAELNTQLATAGRADFQTTSGNEHWFRSIPALVRLDLSTRTATQRSEYSDTPTTTVAYRNLTQSFVIVPRHFGLTMN